MGVDGLCEFKGEVVDLMLAGHGEAVGGLAPAQRFETCLEFVCLFCVFTLAHCYSARTLKEEMDRAAKQEERQPGTGDDTMEVPDNQPISQKNTVRGVLLCAIIFRICTGCNTARLAGSCYKFSNREWHGCLRGWCRSVVWVWVLFSFSHG